jgi:hypothetical protein
MAAWALLRLAPKPEAESVRAHRLAVETDPAVRAEWAASA